MTEPSGAKLLGSRRSGPGSPAAGPSGYIALSTPNERLHDVSHRGMPTRLPVSTRTRGVTAAGWIGIGVMIASLFFLVVAAIEGIHRRAPEAAANCEIAVALLIAGGLLLWRARSLAGRAVRLAISGTETAGVVTGMAMTWYQGWGDDGTTRYALHFNYDDQRGRAHRGTAICAQTDAFQWRAGDRGLVHYDDAHPSRSVWMGQRLEGNAAPGTIVQSAAPTRGPSSPAGEMAQPSLGRLVARSDLPRTVLPGILLFYVGVLTLVFWNRPHGSVVAKILFLLFAARVTLAVVRGIIRGVRQVRHWSKLLRDGTPAEATVTAVRERARLFGRPMPNAVMTTSWTIEYRYPDGAGRTRNDSSAATRHEAVELRPGDTIAIKYNQDASVWIGKLADRPSIRAGADSDGVGGFEML